MSFVSCSLLCASSTCEFPFECRTQWHEHSERPTTSTRTPLSLCTMGACLACCADCLDLPPPINKECGTKPNSQCELRGAPRCSEKVCIPSHHTCLHSSPLLSPLFVFLVDLSHFSLHRVLGRGGFGKVQVIESRINQQYYVNNNNNAYSTHT